MSFGDRKALMEEISSGLMAIRDGDRAVFRAVGRGELVYQGSATADAPDLLLEFAPGYQASWATRLGGVSPFLFADNM